MAYFSTGPGGLGEFGCGADCSCKSCRSASNVGEVYEKEEIAPPASAKPPAAPKIAGWFGESPFPRPRVSVMPGQLRKPPFEVLARYSPGRAGGWNSIDGTIQPCDKIEPAVLTVPFRIDFGDFLKLVCCAIGRWMVFRTDRPAGRQAWCFVKKHEALLWDLHTEMFVKKIPCVELRAQYCRRGGATIDVRIALKRFLNRACRPSSLCRTGVCDPSLVCPPSAQPHPELDPRPAKCKTVDALTRSICDNAKRICKIADELNDPSSRDKCEKARTSCKEALERSKSCGSVTDHRHVPAPTQLRHNFRG
jgi:hypothetical protein